MLKDLYAVLFTQCTLLIAKACGGRRKTGKTVIMSRRRPEEEEVTGDNDWYHWSMDEGRGRK